MLRLHRSLCVSRTHVREFIPDIYKYGYVAHHERHE